MEDLNRRVADCIKKKLKKEISATEFLAMNFASQKEFLEEYSQCFYDVLGETSRDDFEEWYNEKTRNARKKLDQEGKWLLSYLTQVGLPSEMLIQVVQLGIAVDSMGSQREYMWDPDIAPKFLGLALLQWVEQLITVVRFQPNHHLKLFSSNQLGLDSNWIISAIVLTLEELLIRKKLDELGVQIDKRAKYPKLCKELVKALETSGVPPSCEVLKGKGRRGIRNRILHRGYNPTEEEAFRLMGEVVKLAKDFRKER